MKVSRENPQRQTYHLQGRIGNHSLLLRQRCRKGPSEKISGLRGEFPRLGESGERYAADLVWTILRERDIGANLQHYNPVIDAKVKKLLDLPESWILLAQMPFGGIAAQPDPKEKEDVSLRVKSVR